VTEMPQGGLPRRDVTDLFLEASAQGPEGSGEASQEALPEEQIRSLPFPDPSGFLEVLTNGRIRDPVRHRMLSLLERVGPYLPFLGHQP